MSPKQLAKPNRPFKTGIRRAPPDLPQAIEHLWRRLYIRGVDEGLEKLHGYRPGGYHPIHLQDELHHGQYRVIQKLGHGGYSTVWLCRDQKVDTPAYVAIKIHVASETGKAGFEIGSSASLKADIGKVHGGQYMCFPLTRFESQSPNGTHICLVYPVLGPTVNNAGRIFEEAENSGHLLRQVSRQAAEALAALHTCGVCHADFRPSNILLELKSLDGIDEQELISLLGKPETTQVHVRHDSRPTPEVPCAPKYLVYPVDFEDVEHLLDPPRIRVIDFGQSFYSSRPPQPPRFGIPANYAAPEVILDNSGSMAMDLWSLACTLYEIRLGRPLFDVFQLVSLSKMEYVDEISSLLGRPPGQWAEFCEDRPETGMPSQAPGPHEDTEPAAQRACAIYEKIADRLGSGGRERPDPQHQLVSDAEAKFLADLFERLLRYPHDERLGAQDVLEHAWFNIPLLSGEGKNVFTKPLVSTTRPLVLNALHCP